MTTGESLQERCTLCGQRRSGYLTYYHHVICASCWQRYADQTDPLRLALLRGQRLDTNLTALASELSIAMTMERLRNQGGFAVWDAWSLGTRLLRMLYHYRSPGALTGAARSLDQLIRTLRRLLFVRRPQLMTCALAYLLDQEQFGRSRLRGALYRRLARFYAESRMESK